MREAEASPRVIQGRPTQLLHVLTLTPFYPTLRDDANGCFVAETLASLSLLDVSHTIFAVQPFYRSNAQVNPGAPAAEFIRYLSLPRGAGLATAGAFLFARIVGWVRTLHARRKIDVIHAHAPLPCGHAAMLLSRELGIPYVVSVHGLDAYSDVQVRGRAGRWCRQASRLVFRSTNRVICVSEHVRKQVLTGGESTYRTSVVYNGTDPEMFAPATREPVQPTVLSVGNLITTKGHAQLLRALAALEDTHANVVCEIVGTGTEREHLQRLATELKLDRRVCFLGRLSRCDLADAFRRCTLFALPSYYEGLGCAYLEAMASERVAIGCRGQGIEEVIRHGINGWLTDPRSVEDLASGLSALLSNSTLRTTIATRGRHTILQGLTLAHQAARLAAIYGEVAA